MCRLKWKPNDCGAKGVWLAKCPDVATTKRSAQQEATCLACSAQCGLQKLMANTPTELAIIAVVIIEAVGIVAFWALRKRK